MKLAPRLVLDAVTSIRLSPGLVGSAALVLAVGGGSGYGPAPQLEPHFPPVFVTALEVSENIDRPFGPVEVVGAEGDAVTYAIVGGSDRAALGVAASTGWLRFVTPPDFEHPADADGDNVYEVTVSVRDSSGRSIEREITVTVADVSQLQVVVSYPPAGSNLGGEPQTTVTGFVRDVEDNHVSDRDLDSVTVNGQEASFAGADPTRWRVRVPIEMGPTVTLDVAARSETALAATKQVAIANQPLLRSVTEIAVDADNSRAVVLDAGARRLSILDLATRALTVVAAGDGPSFGIPQGLALDLSNDRALVADAAAAELLAIDLTTGERTVLASDRVGTGPRVALMTALALDSDRDRVLALQQGATLFAVDLNSGDRTVLSGGDQGSLNQGSALALDPANNRALIAGPSALVAVDLTTGDRTELSSESIGSGPRLAFVIGLALDSARNRVLAVRPEGTSVLAVDLATGDRTEMAVGDNAPFASIVDIALRDADRAVVVDEVSGAIVEVDLVTEATETLFKSAVGAGPAILGLRSVVWDAANDRALITDTRLDALLQVDFATGDRFILSDDDTGVGQGFDSPRDIAVDGVNNRALVLDSVADAIVSVDLHTGDRTVVSASSRGVGPVFTLPRGIALPNDKVAFVVDSTSDALVGVDLATGNRARVSSDAVGIGAPFDLLRGLVLDTAHARALVMDERGPAPTLIAVDLATGNRTFVSDPFRRVGLGPSLVRPTALDMDPANRRVVVTDARLDAVVTIDLNTGDRRVVSDVATGSGVPFMNPVDVFVDSAHGRALVVDDGLNALIVVELETGERAIVSGGTTPFFGFD